MSARRVVIVCFPGVELLDVAGPTNVFTAAERLLGRDGYRVEIAAETAGPIVTAGGVEIVAQSSLAGLRGPIDTVLVAGGFLAALDEARSIAPAILRLSRRARRVGAVCTGAFLLAEAGILSGKHVVTHWAACDELRRRHPDCHVEPDRIFVHDERIWTSAGVTAGMDLALALVEQDHGSTIALEIARWLVMYLRRPGGQSQFSAPLAAQSAGVDEMAKLTAWIAENLEADLSVEALAKRASMSVRNFTRVFRREIGTTPTAFVSRVRVEAARRALELGSRSVKQIAASMGFGTPETMSRAFRRSFGTTPQEYRERFGASG